MLPRPTRGGGVGEIDVLSNRADLVSGGNALVSIDLRERATVRVELNGANITSSFAVRNERPSSRGS